MCMSVCVTGVERFFFLFGIVQNRAQWDKRGSHTLYRIRIGALRRREGLIFLTPPRGMKGITMDGAIRRERHKRNAGF